MDPKTFTNDDGLLVREMTLRAAADDKREFTGIGVPFGQEIEHWFGRETFDPGSIVLDPAGARVMWQHREPIGVITGHEETPEGFRVTGKISATRTGDEAMTLMRDGVVRSLSIGFEPQEYTVEVRDDGTELIHWTKVLAREFSAVTFPAYDGAAVETIRQQQTRKEITMDPETITRTDLDTALGAVKGELEDSMRAALASAKPEAPAVPQYRSVGDYMKALAAGDEKAAMAYRAYTGGTTKDTVMKDSPLGDLTRLLAERRPIINQFSTGPLPADGLGVEYVELGTDTTKVGQQVKEGDDLVKGKVTKTTKRADILTFGGWAEFSRQEIERASVEILNTTLEAMALRYARVTNAHVRGVYTAQIAAHLAAGGDKVVNVANPADPFAWLDSILDAADMYEDRGYALTRMDASKSVFKKILRLTTPDRLLTDVNGSQGRTISTVDLGVISGNLAGVTMNLLPNAGTEDLAAFVDPVAIRTLENGSPMQLQDENIINLTKSFSLYGYLSSFVVHPDAIVPVQIGAKA